MKWVGKVRKMILKAQQLLQQLKQRLNLLKLNSLCECILEESRCKNCKEIESSKEPKEDDKKQ